MSTIPSIFDIPSYTVVGGNDRAASSGVSAVLLNRGARYPRRTAFSELEKAGFDYIISVEVNQDRYDIEDLSGRFPHVRFVLLQQQTDPGSSVNLAAAEIQSPLFFVLWNDQNLFNGINAAKIAGHFLGEDGTPVRLCTVPVIQNSNFEALHNLRFPILDRSRFESVPAAVGRENQPSLYPQDWVGIYSRDEFIRLGGFDGSITNPHWQLLDFGCRAWLWGSEIRSTQLVRLVYDGEIVTEETTADPSYRLFYLKNIAPVFSGDHAHLPLRRFLPFFAAAGWDIVAAWTEFVRIRRWVSENKNRFRSDIRSIGDIWVHE